MNSRIGVFGGSFDPPDNAHGYIAEYVRQELNFDRIIWVPTRQNPQKQKVKSTIFERIRMIRMVIESLGLTEFHGLDQRQLYKDFPHTTYGLISSLQNDFSQDELFPIIGSDCVENFPNWSDFNKLVGICKLVIVWRQREKPSELECEELKKFGELVIPACSFDISSSCIRNMVKHAKPINGLVPDSVRRYIRTRRLYK